MKSNELLANCTTYSTVQDDIDAADGSLADESCSIDRADLVPSPRSPWRRY